MPKLERTLTDLTDWMSVHDPDRLKSLAAGLSREEIERLSEPLLPYHLPEDVCILYQWRNGQDDYLTDFLPVHRFLPLREAIMEYEAAITYRAHSWNPLWFPIFAYEGDSYCVVLDTERQPSSIVLRSYDEVPDIYVWYSSIEALARTVLDCYREGIYYQDDWCLVPDDPGEELVRQRYSPTAYPFVDEVGRSRFSVISTRVWPLKWKQAIGLSEQDYIPTGSTTTIAEYLDHRSTVGADRLVFQGQVISLAGSGEGHVVRFSDGTGELLIKCPAKTVGNREMRCRDFFEIEAVAQEDDTLRYLEEHFGRHSDVIATRIVFLKEGD